MSDWLKPDNGTLYTDVLDNLKDIIYKASTMMQDTDSDTNIPDNAIKWSVANNRFEIFESPSTWSPLASNYAISVTQLNGQLSTYYTAAENMTGTNIPAGHIDNVSHGILGGDTLHAEVTVTTAGFLSASDKVKLDNLSILTDAEIETAYNNQVPAATAEETTTSIRRFSPSVARAMVDDKLKAGVTAIIFDALHPSSTSTFNVLDGQYQKYTLPGNRIIYWSSTSGKPYTMYLYITTNGYTATLPTGKWANGSPQAINTGLCLLTVNYDGTSYYYMLLSDMK